MPINRPIDTRKLFFKKNIRIKAFDTGKTRVIGLLKCIERPHHFTVRYD